ncbi:MAG: RDD family protein [Planctomycetota bacterium]|jgi:uncharacterized RDD family membrane protein YckC
MANPSLPLLSRLRVGVAAACLLTAMCPALGEVGREQAEPVPSTNMIPAGNAKALWLIRQDAAAGTFDAMVLPAGADASKWQWVQQEIAGHVAAAAAAGDRLHAVLNDPPGYVRISADTGRLQPGRVSGDPRWPTSANTLTVCDAAGLAGAEGPSLLTVVVRTDEAVDKTTLGIFRTIKSQWQHVTDLTDAETTEQTQAWSAVADGTLYVMLHDPGGNQLWAWRDEAWHAAELSERLSTASPAGMFGLSDRLVLAAPTQNEKGTELTLATFDPAEQTFTYQPVVQDDQPKVWPEKTMLHVVSAGEQLAVISQTDGDLQTALCDTNGVIEPSQPVALFHQPTLDRRGATILNYFMGTMMALTIACLVIARRRQPTGPIMVVRIARPTPLGKRFLANLIDLAVPGVVTGIGLAISGGAELVAAAMPPEAVASWQDMVDHAPQMQRAVETMACAIPTVCGFLAYAIYGTVMETAYGATLGKMAFRLHVRSIDRQPITVWQALVRNLLKVVVVIAMGPLALLLVVVLPVITVGRQWFGDILARTLVLQRNSAGLSPQQIAEYTANMPPSPSDESNSLDETSDNE